MSLAQDALRPARPATLVAAFDPVARCRLPVYAACTLLCLCVNYVLGNDIGWDTLNYHYYAGFSALHDRFSQDYFAAGPHSYLNPYAYVPFYLLVSAGLTALQVSSLLAFVHSVFLWLVYELGVCVCPAATPWNRVAIGLCAVFLGALDPNLLSEVGTSFSDVTTGTLVLAGWLLLARTVQAPTLAPMLLGGALLGAASALKLSNAVHAMAATAMLALLPRPWPSKLRFATGFGAAVGVAFVAANAPWSYRLWQHFGNPLFPMLNNVFRSPEFPTQSFICLRFVPSSLLEALWRPFAVANPVGMVQEESIRADGRYAVLMVLGLVLLARWLWRRGAAGASAAPSKPSLANLRLLTAFGWTLTLDWVLWLATSGNARYALPMAAMAAVVLVALLFCLLATRPKVRNYALAAILGAQLVQTWIGADFRYDPLPWSGPWLRVSVPQAVTAEPNLFLSVGILSDSFLVPYLGAGAGVVNFSGGYALGPQGANGERVQSLLRRYAPHVRMLVAGARLYRPFEQRFPTRERLDGVLARFSLRVDPGDCQTIWVHNLPRPLEVTVVGPKVPPPEKQPLDAAPYVTCHVVPAPEAYQSLMAEQPAIDVTLDHLEDACPQLFEPRRPLTEHVGSEWSRLYMNTDLIAWVGHGRLKFDDSVHTDDPTDLGPAAAWEKASQPLICGRRDGHYFARLAPAGSP